MDRFVHSGAMAGVAGGAMLAVGELVNLLTVDNSRFSEAVTTGPFAATAALRLLAIPLLAWALIAVHLRQQDRAGRLSLVGAVVSLGALMLVSGYLFADLFIAPVLAEVAPGILDGTTDSGRIGFGMMLAWGVPNVAFLLLGIATVRARVLPRWGGWALIVAGAINIAPISGTPVITGIALAVTALAVLRPAPAIVARPSPATA